MAHNRSTLKQILDLATGDPDYSIRITGTHKADYETVTDFEFPFSINHQVNREATYIAFPPAYREEKLDVEALQDYLDETAPRAYPPGILKHTPLAVPASASASSSSLPPELLALDTPGNRTFLRPPYGTLSGISVSRRLENLPTAHTITTLAKRINYGGVVTSKLQHSAPEHELIHLSGPRPPNSHNCLQLRTVFRWKPDTSSVQPTVDIPASPSGMNFTIAAWHLEIQHDMLVKRSAFVLDDEYVLFLNLPIKEIAYNLIVAYLQRERERARARQRAAGGAEEGWEMVEDGGGERKKGMNEIARVPVMLWGCDEGLSKGVGEEESQDQVESDAAGESQFEFGFEQ